MAAILGFTQVNRALKIDTPLGPDKLLLRSLSAQEAISQLFRFDLDLISEDDSIKFDSIVGHPVTLHLEIADGERHWNGFISRFSQGPRDERFTTYRAEMVPWLWFLTRTADCRIFQNKTVPDIVQQIFKDLGFSDYKLKLYKTYRTRDYCVQYRETDFNFVSRLMEEEGIYYFFHHEQGKHTLMLADDPGAPQPCPGQPKARCDGGTDGWSPDDTIAEWRLEQEFRPSAWAHTDYNFETPGTGLMVTVQDAPKYEIYDYPGIYSKRVDGDKLAKVRLEEAMAFKKRSSGKSKCRSFSTGYTVEVTDYYRADVNRKWLMTAVYHQASLGSSYTTGVADEATHYENTFECIPADVPFRPPRTTPKQHVQGCQTAMVVGPGGEEIYTDKYGRVKVQFHWDREGKKNENSSCWVRVSHPWAGKGWGSVSIPRIGQEVIVDFLEGDPDQPIIVGRVYNAEAMPPNGLPAGGMVSGIKSNSTPGGGGYNEMSMNDTKGKEKITVHAQYDMDTTVQHDDTQTVVSGDRTITVKAGKHTETINGDTAITVATGSHSLTVQKGGSSVDVQTGTHTHHVKSDVNETFDATQTTTVKQDIKIQSLSATITVDANQKIILQCGASLITMDQAGNIKVSAKSIEISGTDTVKAGVGSQTVTCNNGQVAVSGATINSSATGKHEITGAVVKIN